MTHEELDALLITELAAAGHPDAVSASYTPPGSVTPVACTLLFSAPSLLDGESAAPISAQQRQVQLLRTDVPSPARNGTVELTAAPGEQWRLTDRLDDGLGSTIWSVTRVRA